MLCLRLCMQEEKLNHFCINYIQLENGEPIQILRYEHGQKYEAHIDYFVDEANQEEGGHRAATVLMYLSDVKKGGETVFPASEVCLYKKFIYLYVEFWGVSGQHIIYHILSDEFMCCAGKRV